MTDSEPLLEARRRDVDRRRQRVHQAIAELRADGGEINISAVAARANVHRSFIHRHRDLHAAVIAAEEAEISLPASNAGTPSRRSLQADNANLRERARRLEHHINLLEGRLSELLGHATAERSGLGAADTTAAAEARAETLRQENLDLRRTLEERDEELAAARETTRRLMAEINRKP